MNVKYSREIEVDEKGVLTFLHDSSLGKHRPVSDRERMTMILAQARLIVGARSDGKLIGCPRTLGDGAFVCHLVELAMAKDHHRHGVVRKLVAELRRQVGEFYSLVVRTMPDATGFYVRLGFRKIDDAYVIPREQ